MPFSILFQYRLRPRGQDELHLVDIGVIDAFAASVAAAEAVEHVFPHGAGRLQTPVPRTATLELPPKTPLTGEFLRAQEPAQSRFRVSVGPFDFDSAHGLFSPGMK